MVVSAKKRRDKEKSLDPFSVRTVKLLRLLTIMAQMERKAPQLR